jgi:AcrR family transcriptional regulator
MPAVRRRAPARTSARDRRDQILNAATDCFASRGFNGTTTRELAARVGITEAALYRYFPSKEALYRAIVDRKMSAPDPASAVAAAALAGDDRAVFTGLAREILERSESDPAFLRILLFTALEGHALAQPFFAARMWRLRDFLTGYVERRVSEGGFRGVDPVLAARTFLGMVFDHLLARHVFGQIERYPHPVAVVAETFAGIFLDGVRAESGGGR